MMKNKNVRLLSLLLVFVFAMSFASVGLAPVAMAEDANAEQAANQVGTFGDEENEFYFYFDKVTGKLVIYSVRGNGKMPIFTAENPAPWAAYAASITRIIISEGVTAVSAGAFNGCVALKSVVFPSTIEDVDADAFTGADNIESIEYTGEDASDLKEILETAGVEELATAAESIVVVETTAVEKEAAKAAEAAEEQQAEAEEAKDEETDKDANAAAGGQGGGENAGGQGGGNAEEPEEPEDEVIVTTYTRVESSGYVKHIVTTTFVNGVPASQTDEVRRVEDNELLNSAEKTFVLTDEGLQVTTTMGAPGEEPQTWTGVMRVETEVMEDGATRTGYVGRYGKYGVDELGDVIDVFTLEDGTVRNFTLTAREYNDDPVVTTRLVSAYAFYGNTGATDQEHTVQYWQNKVNGQWVDAQGDDNTDQPADVITVTKYVVYEDNYAGDYSGNPENRMKITHTTTFKNGVPVSEVVETVRVSDNSVVMVNEFTFEPSDSADKINVTTVTKEPGKEDQVRTGGDNKVKTETLNDGVTRVTYTGYNGRLGILDDGRSLEVYKNADGSLLRIVIIDRAYNEDKNTRTETPFVFPPDDTGEVAQGPANDPRLQVREGDHWVNIDANSPAQGELH